MCGVSGLFAYHYAASPVDPEELRRIRDRMAARGRGLLVAIAVVVEVVAVPADRAHVRLPARGVEILRARTHGCQRNRAECNEFYPPGGHLVMHVTQSMRDFTIGPVFCRLFWMGKLH